MLKVIVKNSSSISSWSVLLWNWSTRTGSTSLSHWKKHITYRCCWYTSQTRSFCGNMHRLQRSIGANKSIIQSR